ncbi:MAG: peptidoglycan -binding protein [Defluviicoccus sp.]|nr:peptidoglycan -binding protein [Defluviicoccus sp.]MDE0276084.1 peptidoglycan -binding protein [Defluviicoccus sp.]
MHSRLIMAGFALVGAILSTTAYGKSAKEVFSEVSDAIVAVIVMNERGKEITRGSGVVVSKKNVATNCQIISGAKQIAVRKPQQSGARETYRMVAQLIARSSERDLCLLFVAALSEASTAAPVSLGSARSASIGDEVYAIGAPHDSGLSLSRGIISQLRSDGGKNVTPVIQTDAAVSPRTSGGGLFDQQGKLIGITTLKALTVAVVGFSFAIPVERVIRLIKVVEAPETRLAELHARATRAEEALQVSEKKAKEQNVQIVNLSKRLNAALASKVQELANFRSEFFGRLRKALGNRSDVRIVGDRFVFQSEVLFPSGGATLQPGGRVQIDKLASTITEIAGKIPSDINWVLRVDGHTDRIPIFTPAFPSNWELSTARAIAVVKYLIERGVPATRLAATGFGEFQPIDRGSTIAAFKRNRRIEFKLTLR